MRPNTTRVIPRLFTTRTKIAEACVVDISDLFCVIESNEEQGQKPSRCKRAPLRMQNRRNRASGCELSGVKDKT